jgi:hypothetical protein
MTLEDNAFDSMASMIFGSRIIAQVLKCVAQYSLADHLAEGGRSPQSVAAAAGLDDDAVGRLLRYCACIGLTEANADGTYSSTRLLATLKSDDAGALRSFALAQNGPGQWQTLGLLDETLRTGLPQTEWALGCGLYQYYAQPEHAAEAAAYRAGLAGLNRGLEADLARLVDTRGIGSALDIGGSNGAVVMVLMAANPTLRGAVLDLADVEPTATAEARSRGVADRFEYIAGDFFTAVPASDLYLLKNVLGNWSDDRCQSILDNCRASAKPGARLVIIENAIDETNLSRWAVEVDIITMVVVGGQTRRVADYYRMLETSGLTVTGSAAMSRSYAIIEGIYR